MITLENDYGISLWENQKISQQLDRLALLQEKKIDESFDEKETTVFLFLFTFLKTSVSFLGMIVLSFLFMALWSEEKNRKMNLMYMLPVKRKSIEYAKLKLAVSVSLFLVVSTSIVAFFIGTAFSGMGNLAFPITVISNNQSVIIPLKVYLIKGLFLGISFGVAQLFPKNYLPINLIDSWHFLCIIRLPNLSWQSVCKY